MGLDYRTFINKNIISFSKRLDDLLFPGIYQADGLKTIHNSDFLKNPRFIKAYAAGKATGSWAGEDIFWRVYIACWAGNHAMALNNRGDFVECGVNKGGLSMSVMEYTDFIHSDRHFYLLDTYQGLIDPYISEKERSQGIKGGGYEECYDHVKKVFGNYKNVSIIKGPVPDTLQFVTSDRISYLSIDMNCVYPEISAAEYFWRKIISGGVILLDDYGFDKHINQKEAFDDFAEKRGIEVLSLPTGQGLIFKPV